MSILPKNTTCLWGTDPETGHNQTECGMTNYSFVHGNFTKCPFCGQEIVREDDVVLERIAFEEFDKELG